MRHLVLYSTVASALVLAACAKTEPAPDPVRAVRVMTVSSDSAGGIYEYAAEVRARTESRLGFRVGGKLIRRSVDAGAVVKAGQVLAQLDPQDLRLGQDAARAALVSAQVNYDQTAADFKRYKDLRDQGFISSADLENALVAHPEVREAAVIAVPHSKWQERPIAIVVPREGAQLDPAALREFLSGKFAKWQLPDAFVFVDELPHTSTGKLLKTELRKRYQEWKWEQ